MFVLRAGFVLVLGLFPASLIAQAEIRFTSNRNPDPNKAKTSATFKPGALVYGIAATKFPLVKSMFTVSVGKQAEPTPEPTITVEAALDGGPTVQTEVGVRVNGQIVKWKVPYSSGVVAGKLSVRAWYFTLLPDSANLTSASARLMQLMCQAPKGVLTIDVEAGGYHSISGQVKVDLSDGCGPWANWSAPFLAAEALRVVDAKKLADQQADAARQANAQGAADSAKRAIEASDSIPMPRARMTDATLEKEITDYLKAQYEPDGVNVFKIYIIVDDWSYERNQNTGVLESRVIYADYLAKNTKTDVCFIKQAKLRQQNIAGTQFSKFRIADASFTRPVKCSRFAAFM